MVCFVGYQLFIFGAMFPVLLKFKTPTWLAGILGNEITLYSYGFMILVGVLMAYLWVWYRRKDFGLDSDTISELFMWCFAGVFIGGKLFYYFENPAKYLEQPALMFKNMGAGFVFYGSFIVTIPILIWVFRKKKLPVLPMFDLVAIAGTLVHGFGKVGCLLSGCCHGLVCEGKSWGITYHHPQSSAEPLHTALYPTQVYDAVMVLGIGALLIYLYQRKSFHGQLILLYAMIYGVGRTITEIYRGDEARGFIIGNWLSHSQFIAVLILGVSVYLWLRWRKKHPVQKSVK